MGRKFNYLLFLICFLFKGYGHPLAMTSKDPTGSPKVQINQPKNCSIVTGERESAALQNADWYYEGADDDDQVQARKKAIASRYFTELYAEFILNYFPNLSGSIPGQYNLPFNHFPGKYIFHRKLRI